MLIKNNHAREYRKASEVKRKADGGAAQHQGGLPYENLDYISPWHTDLHSSFEGESV